MRSAPFRLTLLLGALIALTPLGTDLYVPALPAIAQTLQASVERTQHTVTTFFLGLAVGQLVWGPLSDRFGRKPVLVVGIALALLASVAGAFASTVEALIWVRLAQGFGLSAGPVAARSVVRDLFAHEHAAQLLARMTIVFSVVPIVAPIAGAGLLRLGWPAVFIALAAATVLLIAAVLRVLPETAPVAPRRPLVRAYGAIVREPRFGAHLLLLLCTFSGIFAFVSNSTFVLQQGLHVTPQAYALLFATVMLGQIVGAWLGSRLVMRLGIGALLRLGTRLACVAGIAALGLALARVNHWSAVVGPMAVYMFASSCIIPAATAAALSPFPRAAGATSSLIGTLQFALGAAVSGALGASFDGTAAPMALVVALGGTSALLCERFLVRKVAARRQAPAMLR
jgi:DHA1 family bicyclomycin/chloramphenicol resistance-like MFS transporter